MLIGVSEGAFFKFFALPAFVAARCGGAQFFSLFPTEAEGHPKYLFSFLRTFCFAQRGSMGRPNVGKG